VTQLYPRALGTLFSRLLRHAWVTLGAILVPGHHRKTRKKLSQISKVTGFHRGKVTLSCFLYSKLIVLPFFALGLFACTSQHFLLHFSVFRPFYGRFLQTAIKSNFFKNNPMDTEVLPPSNIFILLVSIFMPLPLQNLIFSKWIRIYAYFS
jgi:hypothetical protein